MHAAGRQQCCWNDLKLVSVLLYGAETWPVTKKDIMQKMDNFLDEVSLRHSRSHPLAQALKCRHPKGNWGTPNRAPT